MNNNITNLKLETINNGSISHNEYIIEDSIVKGLLESVIGIELLMFARAYPGVLALPVLSPAVIASMTLVYTAFSVYNFYSRESAKENNNEYYGAIAAGSLKYVGKQLFNNANSNKSLTKDLLLKAALGAGNNLTNK